ncbi:MAG: hypothetical protein NVSMB19_18100 [Vulcanimicrobiaceae bacterium]
MTLSLAVLRAVVGLVFVVAGVHAATHFDAAARDFASWHVPQPAVAVRSIAAAAIVCGGMLAAGILTRPVALLLATIAIGALLTAGRYSGGAYVILPPLLFAACVVFAWRSGRLGGRPPARPPGVQ